MKRLFRGEAYRLTGYGIHFPECRSLGIFSNDIFSPQRQRSRTKFLKYSVTIQ
ncbi:MAG: hypothetical protein LBJ00_18650 [Planctomycetaceae bacterium]|nr:hypothetical protein [Planctomycetaceae bacterium]